MGIQGGRLDEPWMVSIKISRKNCYLMLTFNLNKYGLIAAGRHKYDLPSCLWTLSLLTEQGYNWVNRLDLQI